LSDVGDVSGVDDVNAVADVGDVGSVSDVPDVAEVRDVPTPLRVVRVDDVVFDFSTNTAGVVLREAEGSRRALTIPVAVADATSIYQAWHRVVGRRPTTSELVTFILQETHVDVIAARITRVESGVFFAELDLMTPRGRRVFDCRPSDALIITLRQVVVAPVLVSEEVLADS
jgi:bifunctional DNase/RNase